MKTYLKISSRAIIALNLFFLCLSITLTAQNPTWQWAKKGGTTDNLGTNREEIKAIRTDANGNVYILAPVGINNLLVDGNPKPTYGLPAGDGSATLDYVIASFTCDGTYRWSKVIGGQESDRIDNIQLDSEGNVYAVGRVKNNYDYPLNPGTFPQVHFDTDVVLPYAEENAYNQTLFLIKYNSEGVFQWLKMPQAADSTFLEANNSSSIDLQVVDNGNVYWICKLPAGNFCNGQFINNVEGIYILKYNSLGDFLNASKLEIQNTLGISLRFKTFKPKNLNQIYITKTLNKSNTPSANEGFIVGNESIDFTKFVACFDLEGNFLWKVQNNSLINYCPLSYELASDSENNIYFMSGTATVGFVNEPNPVMDSFNGVQFPIPTDYFKLPLPFVTKLDQNGNTIWQSSGITIGGINAQMFPYGLGFNNAKNEIATVGAQAGLQWGNFSIQQTATNGYDPYVVRLNKDTGVPVGMETFTSNNNTDDAATAIAADPLGNYLVGGRFWSQITIGNTVLQNTGAQTDFFIVKLGTSDCTLSTEQYLFKDLKVFPNPVKDLLHIDNQEVIKYQLYNSLGMQMQSNTLPVGGTIDCSSLSSGFYILNLINQNGEKKVIKILKE